MGDNINESSSSKPRLVIGLETTGCALSLHNTTASDGDNKNLTQNAHKALQIARPDGYDFVTTIIQCNTPSTKTVVRKDLTVLESRWWNTSVVGVFPHDCNAGKDGFSAALRCGLEWSLHMNLPAVLIPPLPTDDKDALLSYINALSQNLQANPLRDTQIWIPVTLSQIVSTTDFPLLLQMIDYSPNVHAVLVFENEEDGVATIPNVKAFTHDLLQKLHVWIGTIPIAAVALPTSVFLQNKKGFPTLPKYQQTVLMFLLRRIGRNVKVLVQQQQHSSNSLPLTADQLEHSFTLPYVQYLQHFRSSRAEITQSLDTPECLQETDYLDSLQSPLQPLADHLQFQMYETFEKDPVKYAQYQAAVLAVLRDTAYGAASATAASNENKMDESTAATATTPAAATSSYNIFVVGAGRGPLVTACVQALRDFASAVSPTLLTDVHIYAVEKNPSAVLYLRSKVENEWNGLPISIVASDLRNLSLGGNDVKANLVVSELLGSFGCNELSPECLDAFLQNSEVCNAKTVSIPCRYISHAAPVCSTKLYQAARSQALYPTENSRHTTIVGLQRAMETPYVVRTHAASQMHASIDCWSFSHHGCAASTTSGIAPTSVPAAPIAPSSLDRSCSLSFPNNVPTDSAQYGSGYGPLDTVVTALDTGTAPRVATPALPYMCTGILGTFSAILYENKKGKCIHISINPNASFSTGMFSWFPLYFPIATPVLVSPNTTLRTLIWRKCDASQVWYEWSVQVVNNIDGALISASLIHNPNGRSYFVSKV